MTCAVLGPYKLLKLSKQADDIHAADLARSAGDALWTWVREQAAVDRKFSLQLNEPCLGMVMNDDDIALRDAAYGGSENLGLAQTPVVTVQFGRASAETVEALGRRGFAVQVPVESVPELRRTAAWEAQPEHLVAVMDGRSVWPDDFGRALDALAQADDGKVVRLVPSTSLMFLPVTTEGEDLPPGFQFAREKARALAEWPAAI